MLLLKYQLFVFRSDTTVPCAQPDFKNEAQSSDQLISGNDGSSENLYKQMRPTSYTSKSKFDTLPANIIIGTTHYLQNLDILSLQSTSNLIYHKINCEDFEQKYQKQKKLIFQRQFIELWNNSNFNLSFDDWIKIPVTHPLRCNFAEMWKYFVSPNNRRYNSYKTSVSSTVIGIDRMTGLPFIAFLLRPLTIIPSVVYNHCVLSVLVDGSGIVRHELRYDTRWSAYDPVMITTNLVNELLLKGVSEKPVFIHGYQVVLNDKLSFPRKLYYDHPIKVILICFMVLMIVTVCVWLSANE